MHTHKCVLKITTYKAHAFSCLRATTVDGELSELLTTTETWPSPVRFAIQNIVLVKDNWHRFWILSPEHAVTETNCEHSSRDWFWQVVGHRYDAANTTTHSQQLTTSKLAYSMAAPADCRLTLGHPLLPYGYSFHSDAQPWASECPDVKNYKWRLNLVWHRMLYSCTHMATMDIKVLNQPHTQSMHHEIR